MVVVAGMNTLYGLRQQGNDITVATDIVVIAALSEPGLAAGNQVVSTERTVAPVGHAVDND